MEFKKSIIPILLIIAALSVSFSAAFYSVTGLSKLFVGASTEVIIMASALEFSKIVAASFAYQYWKDLNSLLKIYIVTAITILILITSIGIYGFLTSAYKENQNELDKITNIVNLNESKLDGLKDTRDRYEQDIRTNRESASELRKALSNNVIQYKDKESGEIITTTSSANRKTYQEELKNINNNIDKNLELLNSINDSISKYQNIVIDTKNNSNMSGELGTLIYLSDITGKDMDVIVNYLVLLIIFVFDPLAISLVISANIALSKNKEHILDKPESTKTDVEETLIDGDLETPEPTPTKPEPTPTKSEETTEINEEYNITPTPSKEYKPKKTIIYKK